MIPAQLLFCNLATDYFNRTVNTSAFIYFISSHYSYNITTRYTQLVNNGSQSWLASSCMFIYKLKISAVTVTLVNALYI